MTVCKKVSLLRTSQKCTKSRSARTSVVEEKVKVCTYQCVTEQQKVKCTVYVRKSVPCTATRTVRVCVPYEECVTACKLVPKTVTRQVACGSGLQQYLQHLQHLLRTRRPVQPPA